LGDESFEQAGDFLGMGAKLATGLRLSHPGENGEMKNRITFRFLIKFVDGKVSVKS
jgi:hypothetical protein